MTNEQSAILRKRTNEFLDIQRRIEYGPMDAHDKAYTIRNLEGYLRPYSRWPDETMDEWFERTTQEWDACTNQSFRVKSHRITIDNP